MPHPSYPSWVSLCLGLSPPLGTFELELKRVPANIVFLRRLPEIQPFGGGLKPPIVDEGSEQFARGPTFWVGLKPPMLTNVLSNLQDSTHGSQAHVFKPHIEVRQLSLQRARRAR